MFKESETIELKRIATDEIKKEIVAFANTNGGRLYVGVDDDGSVAGLEDADGTALQISNMVRDSIKPDVSGFVHYETQMTNGREILMVEIQKGTNRPYYIAKKGLRPDGVYVRQGFSSVPASDDSIRRMIRESDGERFEDMRSLEQNLTFTEAKAEFEKRNVQFEAPQMRSLGLVSDDGVYTNLALLLSDECRHTMKIAVLDDENRLTFKDRKECTGSIFHQMNEAFKYIDMCNRTSSTFEGLYRIDTRDYPREAIRETLLNCIVHREYGIQASTLISIFPNRIEFVSIGGLAAGVSLRDLELGVSVCRNPKLANVFYRLELIEAYGTGIRRTMDSYREYGMKPIIETSPNAFKVTLPNINEPSSQTLKESPRTPYAKSVVRTESKGPEGDWAAAPTMLANEGKVVSFIERRGLATRKEIESVTGMSQASCVRMLNGLERRGVVERHGKARNTYYTLAGGTLPGAKQ